ncbi:MAG: RcpC/CpaB family pilus assembly protein [Elusimicrobia bacterium]|nr:RcpC/CpaB family pilus assembly protein [Elusimicrobiota bacterium]
MKTLVLTCMAALALAALPPGLAADEAAAPGTPAAAADAGKAEKPVKAEKAPAGLVAGYRGTSIALPGDQLLYLRKGDRVDVLVTFDAAMKDSSKETMTATILQNVVVINVARPGKLTGTGAVELLLNPNEAQYLALSVSQAKRITIAVRAAGDTELHPMEMASFRRLIK